MSWIQILLIFFLSLNEQTNEPTNICIELRVLIGFEFNSVILFILFSVNEQTNERFYGAEGINWVLIPLDDVFFH